MSLVILDFETTGLLGVSALPETQQPRVIEIGMLRVDFDTLTEHARLATFVNPGTLIPPEVTRITGISDHMVKDAPKFAAHLPAIRRIFLGVEYVLAHNAQFDLGVLEVELGRLGQVNKFPWPMERMCTVEMTSHLPLKDRKLLTLYEHLFGVKPNQTHRAMEDVLLLHKVVMKLRAQGVL